jgi:hypothetical protein
VNYLPVTEAGINDMGKALAIDAGTMRAKTGLEESAQAYRYDVAAESYRYQEG